MSTKDARTVWSSESGDLRKKNIAPSHAVVSLPPEKQTTYPHRDSKRRGGSKVTLIKNLVLSEDDMNALTRKIKQACGTGGTVKGGVIEIQGENREKIADVLIKLGYKVKLAGG
jgi:translation initiation factor 1